MVKGLATFKAHFAGFEDRYVLIGGTAASLTMEAANLEFRATKDFDVVLVVEALDGEFAQVLWRFVKSGGYAIRQTSSGRPCFYRFQNPADNSYPHMVELFARRIEGLQLGEDAHLTPLPIDEEVPSLSAILLDDDYYRFVLEGRRQVDGLAWIGEDRLIPLKASAYVELSDRLAAGEDIDRKNVRKHLNDVFRLSQVLTAEQRIALPGNVAHQFAEFLERAAQEAVDLKSLDIRAPSTGHVMDRLRHIFQPAH